MTFAPLTWWAWITFHVLDIAAVLVIAGCGYFLWRRVHDREAATGQRLGYDFVPLVALVAISVTGLLLTFSSALLDGAGYEFLAILHMGVVVLSLIFIPFGKFFHVDPTTRHGGRADVQADVTGATRASCTAPDAARRSRARPSCGTCRRRWTSSG